MLLAVRSDDLPAWELDRDPAACLACEWLPPKFVYVDPKKDAKAEALAINTGLNSRRQATSDRRRVAGGRRTICPTVAT